MNAAHKQSVTPSSKLGFFSKPYRETQGKNKGKIIKSYTLINDKNLCEKLLQLHDLYVQDLRKSGILTPPTEAFLVEKKGKYSIQIIQEPFEENELVRGQMQTSNKQTCIKMMGGVLDGCTTVLNYFHQHKNESVFGFHPTLRNYAVRENSFWYFDTFPPMSRLSVDELQWVILNFSPHKTPMFFKRFAKKFMHKVTDEYYFPDKMFLGIVGSSCRLRPEFKTDFLESAKKKAADLLNTEDRNKILKQLEQAPQLPLVWTFVRKILGKEGKANV